MLIEQIAGWMDAADAKARLRAALDLAAFLEQEHGAPISEREAAEAALTCLADDPEIEVRLALSEALSTMSAPPRFIVLALAADEPAVSLPLLARSTVLLDGELIRTLETGTTKQQVAIACRSAISPAVCAAIAERATQEACLAAVLNPGARLRPEHFFKLAERFGEDEQMRRIMLARDDIGMPARIHLIERYALSLAAPEGTGEDERLIDRKKSELREICDKAVISFAGHVSDDEIGEMVVALIAAEKLTTAFLLRAICMGNITLFAYAVATLSEQPVDRVARMIAEERRNAFHVVYTKAGLPAAAFGVFFSAISAWKSVFEVTREEDDACLPYRVTRRILTLYEGETSEEVDELLLLLRKICTETARESARYRMGQLSLTANKATALPAPVNSGHSADPLPEDELLMFACYLADELAEFAEADEADNAELAEKLVAANTEEWGMTNPADTRLLIEKIDRVSDELSAELQSVATEMRQATNSKGVPRSSAGSLLNRAA